MKTKNICHLIPKQSEYDPIQIVNFVYESEPQFYEELRSIPTFRVHYVTAGKGTLQMASVAQTVQEGDIFFSFPAVPYTIEPEEDLKYIYISYLGTRANSIREDLKLSQSHCVFHGFRKTASMWKNTFKLPPEVINLRCESILLYVFSEIGIQFYEKKCVNQGKNVGLLIKKYIDENYSDPDMTLEKVGNALSYHRKYISMAFKEEFKMGFTNYLNSVRVHQAYVLIEQGFTSMKDIASLCGFCDPFYFSRVFKDHMGISPKELMKTVVKKES